MATAHNPLIKRLEDVLPESIAWLPHQSLEDLLGISESQRRRDTAVLQALSPKGWKYTQYSKGYRRSAVEVFWVFRQLVHSMRRSEAIASINETMEAIHYERSRQKSSRAS